MNLEGEFVVLPVSLDPYSEHGTMYGSNLDPAHQHFFFTYFGRIDWWENIFVIVVLVVVLRLHLYAVGCLHCRRFTAAGVVKVGPFWRTRLGQVVLFYEALPLKCE